MGALQGLLNVWNLVAHLTLFVLLFLVGLLKVLLVGPLAALIVLVGNSGVIVGLWPCHAGWTFYCLSKTKKYGTVLKVTVLLSFIIPILLWPAVAVLTSAVAAVAHGFYAPLLATFAAVAPEVKNKFVTCIKDGTWSTIVGSCTIVRDFADLCFHSYFSYMDGLLESWTENQVDLSFAQIPSCIIAGTLGLAIDVPMFTVIVIYKTPIMLYKGWKMYLPDLIGTAGPILETAYVPFAGLLILLWPPVVAVLDLAAIASSFFFGSYAAAVTYQENSMKEGLVYVISIISMFDEYTNDILSLRGGSCFPRPRHQKPRFSGIGSSDMKHLADKTKHVYERHHPVRDPSMKIQELKAVVVWDNLFKACEVVGENLVKAGAIRMSDLEEWQYSKNKIVNIGLPAYVFLQCFLRSIERGSAGFLMRDGSEITSFNRPEGRIFEFFFKPMSSIKDQIKAANLRPTEQAYLCKLTLFCGNTYRVGEWQNGGIPPAGETRRFQLDEISKRLQEFGLKISRMPTFRRRFQDIVKALKKVDSQKLDGDVNISIGDAD